MKIKTPTKAFPTALGQTMPLNSSKGMIEAFSIENNQYYSFGNGTEFMPDTNSIPNALPFLLRITYCSTKNCVLIKIIPIDTTINTAAANNLNQMDKMLCQLMFFACMFGEGGREDRV